ncbi:hypothetical protein Tco_1054566 [Tanacetum coccineum]|uniref:Uncharacterized protein n=1 Tax=Tanacetum coccineum TaxID=301880 RepID=A0ABQ5GY23_9ASTR
MNNPEEDDEEDPEEDPADYLADRGDDDDAEEEHLAPTDPAADPDPYLAYRVTARMSIRPWAPAPFLSEEVVERLNVRTTPGPGYEVGESSAAGTARQVGPATARADLYGFADMLDAAPGRQTSKELGYGITDTWDDLEDEIIYSPLDDARYDRALLRARVNMLYRDRPFHRLTALLMEEEARVSRTAWVQSMDACDQVHSEGISLRTTANGRWLCQSESLSCSMQTRRDRRGIQIVETAHTGDKPFMEH